MRNLDSVDKPRLPERIKKCSTMIASLDPEQRRTQFGSKHTLQKNGMFVAKTGQFGHRSIFMSSIVGPK
jgi:hypothetical protein